VSIPERNWSSWSASTSTSHNTTPFIDWGINTWDFTSSFDLVDKLVEIVTVWTVWVWVPWTTWWRIVLNINPYHTIGISVFFWINSISFSPAFEVIFPSRSINNLNEGFNCFVNLDKLIFHVLWGHISSWHTFSTGEIFNWWFRSDSIVSHVVNKRINLTSSWLTSAGEHIDINIGDSSCSGIFNLGGSITISTSIWAPGSWNSETHTVWFQARVSWSTCELREINSNCCWGGS
jgi:hypothetical protein